MSLQTACVSGVVPRELVAGVIWCEKAEADFERLVDAHLDSGATFDKAVRESRWQVEIDLHRKWVKRQVAAALRCKTNDEKLALMKDWIAQYGSVRAQRLASYCRDGRLSATIVRSW